VLPDSDFIAEDVAWDPVGSRFLLSGIRRSVVVAINRSGAITPFLNGPDKGSGYLALAVDSANGVLWATTEAIPQALGYDSTMAGRSSVLRYDLRTGKLLQRYDMPTSEPHGAGDIAVDEHGDLYIADTGPGAIYVIRKGQALTQLVPPGEFFSPQGPAIAKDGRHFYISDYLRGIARVDRASGKIDWVRHSPTIATNGVDGLTMADSHTLIAVQNGTNPNRVVRFTLDSTGLTIIRAEVIAQDSSTITEPTHGVFVGGDYYFIANGGFDSYGDDGKLREGERAVAPRVLKVSGLR
jgi:sugar lactone lactonase YvrE